MRICASDMDLDGIVNTIVSDWEKNVVVRWKIPLNRLNSCLDTDKFSRWLDKVRFDPLNRIQYAPRVLCSAISSGNGTIVFFLVCSHDNSSLPWKRKTGKENGNCAETRAFFYFSLRARDGSVVFRSWRYFLFYESALYESALVRTETLTCVLSSYVVRQIVDFVVLNRKRKACYVIQVFQLQQ